MRFGRFNIQEPIMSRRKLMAVTAVIESLLLFSISASGEMNAEQVLSQYRQSQGWMQSVSMKIDVKGSQTGYKDKGPYGASFTFRRTAGNAEWRGNIFGFDKDGNIDPNNNHTINDIISAGRYISFTSHVGKPVTIAALAKDYAPFLEDLLENSSNGGPLWGRIYGNNHKSIPDLLADSEQLSIRQENIGGLNCFVLEGVGDYGATTAWIAPDKGYNAVKWMILKTDGDLFDDVPVSAVRWTAVFEASVFTRLNGLFVPTAAVFTLTDTYQEGNTYTTREQYSLSEVVLNPDFAALSAFNVNLPNGTKVQVRESPGIRYIGKDGAAAPAVDGPTFDEIEKMVDHIKAGQ